jgi:hypothetical protein
MNDLNEYFTSPVILTILVFICAAGIVALVWLVNAVLEEARISFTTVTEEAQEKLDELNRRVADSEAKLKRYQEWSKQPQHSLGELVEQAYQEVTEPQHLPEEMQPFGANGPFKQRGAVDPAMIGWLLGIGVALAAIGVIRELKFQPSFQATLATIVAAILFGMAAVAWFFVWAVPELVKAGADLLGFGGVA